MKGSEVVGKSIKIKLSIMLIFIVAVYLPFFIYLMFRYDTVKFACRKPFHGRSKQMNHYKPIAERQLATVHNCVGFQTLTTTIND